MYDFRELISHLDLEVLIETIKWVRNLANISPMKDMVSKEHNPGPEAQTGENNSSVRIVTY
jgi:hypothetical protein